MYSKDIKIHTIVQKINDLMISNRDYHLLMKNDGSYWKVSHFKLNDVSIKDHLEEKKTVGIFSGKYLTKFICFDVDTQETAELDTRHLVNVLVEHFNIHRNDIHVSLSGNKGYHVDLYFNKAISIELVKRFYTAVRIEAGFSKDEVELRPTNNQGLKLPLGINRKTNSRCWYINKDTYKPIKDLDYILEIEPMDAEFFELEFSNLNPIILNEDNTNEINEIIDSIELDVKNIEKDLQQVEDILKRGYLKYPHTRNNMTLALAIYLKSINKYSADEITDIIINILIKSKREHGTVNSDETFIKKETKRIIQVVFKYNYKMSKKTKQIKLYKEEIEDILKIKSKHIKQLYLIHLITSKRYARENGEYFLTYESMSKMGATKNRKRVANYINELEQKGYLEIIQQGIWDKDYIKEKGKARCKPNVYKVKKKIISNNNMDSITIEDNQSLDLDKILKKADEKLNIDLKKYLPINHYYNIKKVS
jgi:hypothetical protein